jgi:hypothetical protein
MIDVKRTTGSGEKVDDRLLVSYMEIYKLYL